MTYHASQEVFSRFSFKLLAKYLICKSKRFSKNSIHLEERFSTPPIFLNNFLLKDLSQFQPVSMQLWASLEKIPWSDYKSSKHTLIRLFESMKPWLHFHFLSLFSITETIFTANRKEIFQRNKKTEFFSSTPFAFTGLTANAIKKKKFFPIIRKPPSCNPSIIHLLGLLTSTNRTLHVYLYPTMFFACRYLREIILSQKQANYANCHVWCLITWLIITRENWILLASSNPLWYWILHTARKV